MISAASNALAATAASHQRLGFAATRPILLHDGIMTPMPDDTPPITRNEDQPIFGDIKINHNVFAGI